MTMFVIQTAILLSIAFVLGCLIGYLLRMMFAPGNASGQPSEALVSERSLAAGTQSEPVAAANFVGKTNSATDSGSPSKPKRSKAAGKSSSATATTKRAATSAAKPATGKSATSSKTAAKSGKSSAKEKATTKPAEKASTKSVATVAKAAPSRSKTGSKATAKVAAAVKTGGTTKKAAATKTQAKSTAGSSARASAKTSAAAAGKDDLKRIRGVGPKLEARMNAVGIMSYADIAAWTAKQQREFGEKLSFPGRIERDEWVKQAKLLAKGKDTAFSKRVDKGQVGSSKGKVTATALGKKPPVLKKQPAKGPENLTLIDGVGTAIEKKLFALGIYKFSQIAKWTKDQQVWIGNEIGAPGRPERENWVADAKTLADGGTTEHAKKVERGAIKTSRKS